MVMSFKQKRKMLVIPTGHHPVRDRTCSYLASIFCHFRGKRLSVRPGRRSKRPYDRRFGLMFDRVRPVEQEGTALGRKSRSPGLSGILTCQS